MRTIIYLVFLLSISLTSCAPALIAPVQSDAENGSAQFPGLTYNDLSSAHRLYINKCGGCHFLYRPYQFEVEKWKKELPEMKGKAKLTEKEYSLLISYIMTMNDKLPNKR